MPKPTRRNLEKENLKEKVAKWVHREGYPFELRIGRQLRDAGFHDLEHGRFYRDPETGKWREIDIVAVNYADEPSAKKTKTAPGVGVGLQFVVECKHGNRPWVVMAAPPTPGDNECPSSLVVGQVAAAFLSQAEMPTITARGQFGRGLNLGAIGFGDFRGHNVVQTAHLSKGAPDDEPERRDGSGQPNAAYNSVRSVVAASTALAKESDGSSARQIQHNRTFAPVVVTLPVIVCNAPLFRLSLADDGTERLEEIQEIAITSPTNGDLYSATILVQIVRPGAPLTRLVKRAMKDVKQVTSILLPRWDEYSARTQPTRSLTWRFSNAFTRGWLSNPRSPATERMVTF